MSVFIKYTIMFSRLFFISFSSNWMMYLVTKTIFPKKRSAMYFFGYWAFHFFIKEILVTTILSGYYRDELWFQILYSLMIILCSFISLFIFCFVFEGELVKICVVALLVDSICGSFNIIPALLLGMAEGGFYYVNLSGVFNYHDFLIPIAGGLIFYPLYRIATPFLKRFNNYQMKYPLIWWSIIALILTFAFFNNQIPIKLIVTHFSDNPVIFQATAIFASCFALAGILLLLSYTRKLRKKRAFFLENTQQMEDYYDDFQKQLRQMEEHYDEMSTDMEKLQKMETFLQGNHSIDENHTNTQWVKKYLATLKDRYDELKPLFFCDDYAVDATLNRFAEKCRQENIKTDILFQEYQRGNMDEEDVIQIIHKLRDYGLQIANSEDSGSENKEIQLHVGSVKNQLIFSMSATCATPVPVRKRDFRTWIKKYDGMMVSEQTDGTQTILLGVNNKK